MTSVINMGRRRFLQASAVGAASLVLGFRLSGNGEAMAAAAAGDQVIFNPNAWLEITEANEVIIHVPWSELGQGCLTAVAMLLAEELEADWEKVDIRKAKNDPRFGRMGTGGSRSIRMSWDPVRQAGAAARTMLLEAAGSHWNISTSQLKAEKGYIINKKNGKKVSYGELAVKAATLDVPENVPLKPASEHKLIGQSLPRIDSPDKIIGKAEFGCDVRLPGMVFAVIARPPVFGGTLDKFDGTGALAVAGVSKVFATDAGVVVVAATTWAAMQGREALTVSWHDGEHADLSSADISAMLSASKPGTSAVMRHDGNVEDAMAKASSTLEVVYELPFLSHSPMEPMNCTVRLARDKCEVWAPIQSVSWGQQVAAQAAGIDPENVVLQPTYAGGGFGRRLMVDYVAEAVAIAREIDQPVQLFWTREDNTLHGFYRPASHHTMAAAFDDSSQPIAWSHHLAAPSISAQLNPQSITDGKDDGAVDGAVNVPYGIDNIRVTYGMTNTAVPVGWLRSVYNTQNALANECFFDEMAVAGGTDPLQLRLDLIKEDKRLRGTLKTAEKVWGWPRKMPDGHGQGLACHSSFGSSVTMMAEVSDGANNRITVHRVLVVVDCGPVVNPDGVRSQMEGAVGYALSALLREEITIKNGRVQQSNFDDYPVLRFDEMPDVEVVMVDSGESIGGIGEPGYPPLGPAVLNALFDASGRRVRKLPLSRT